MTGLLRPTDWRPLLEKLDAERGDRDPRFQRPAHAYAQTTRRVLAARHTTRATSAPRDAAA